MSLINTYVTSVNGMTGDDFYELIGTMNTTEATDKVMNFTPVHSRNKHVIVDSEDIKVSGTTGNDIKQRCTAIASGIQRLLVNDLETEDDYELQIQYGYSLVYVN